MSLALDKPCLHVEENDISSMHSSRNSLIGQNTVNIIGIDSYLIIVVNIPLTVALIYPGLVGHISVLQTADGIERTLLKRSVPQYTEIDKKNCILDKINF